MSDGTGKLVQPLSAGKRDSKTYGNYLQQSRESLESSLAKFKEYKAEYKSLQKTLVELPDEIEYQAMVPVGPLAFFPGKIVHTNEILVLLGDNWFVDRSAKQAAEIARRREEYIDDRIAVVRKELQGMYKREDIMDKKSKDPVTQLVQGDLPEKMYNDDGDEIVDIKEELGSGQLPLFSEEESDRANNKKVQKGGSGKVQVAVSDTLHAKRMRAIDQLERSRSSMGSDNTDYSKLSTKQREILEILDQIGSDEEEGIHYEKEADDKNELDYSAEESNEGDAFSDEDRANAACDDDDDDYNGSPNVVDNDTDDSVLKFRVIERRVSSSTSLPRSSESPKSILKPSTPISMFKDRRQAASTAGDSSGSGIKRLKSVSFNAVAEAYTQPNTELLDENNIDEDVSRVADLMNVLSTRSSVLSRSSGSSADRLPKISVINEVSAEEEREEEETAKPSSLGELRARGTTTASSSPYKFKPNTAALSGVRSGRASSSTLDSGPHASVRAAMPSKAASPKTAVGNNPMKTRVVERSSAIDENVNMLDVVDEEIHAREIAQAYNRMRFAKMSAGKLDGAADIAERVLSEIPGITLVDGKGGDEENISSGQKNPDDGYERIELPSDPSPYSSTSSRPPEVIHKPRPKASATTLPTPTEEAIQVNDSGSISDQKHQAKPKMSRFKAQRLGLE
ncbi:uri1, prefoldin-like chaperone [Coemansia sp. RSA 1200]|nr:uri1, prefoldin-like chaperone [Coemansia sp. RSA 1200]